MNDDIHLTGGAERLPLMAAAALQDDLMTVCNDLERLLSLLEHASDALLVSFHAADREAGALDASPLRERLRAHLGRAVTALQFQDMASQLVAHSQHRLRHCADRLARDAMADDSDGEALVTEAPPRPNPVTQDEMDAGSIELF